MSDAKQNTNHMYIGPTILALGLKMNTIYQDNTMPPQLQNLVATKPMLASLFVPTAKLAAAKVAIRQKGSIEYLSATEMMKLMRGQPATNKRK